jgi:lysophospholipase L1-like esterase
VPLQEFLNKPRIFQFRFRYLHLLVVLFIAILIAYISWEVYWYHISGLAFIKWHTHIFATTLFAGLLWLPFFIIHKRYSTPQSQNALLSATSVWATLILLEVILIITGMNHEYIEERWGYYQSPYKNDVHNVFFVPAPNAVDTNRAPEYTYMLYHNSLGFADNEWSQTSENDSLRIVTLGDSFTEGDGAPTDSSYPAILEKLLKEKYPLANVMNAGIRGSDPFYNFNNLNKRLLKFHPDIVLQTISIQDIYLDLGIRGGFERFVSDSIVRYKKAPLWEPVYAASYVARMFLKLAGFDISNPSGSRTNRKMINEKNQLLNSLIAQYDSLATLHHFKVVYILLPMKEDMKSNKYNFDFSPFMTKVDQTHTATVLSLFPAYKNYLKRTGLDYKDTYWINDGHHNPTGYDMMARCIGDYLEEQLLNKSLPDTSGKYIKSGVE